MIAEPMTAVEFQRFGGHRMKRLAAAFALLAVVATSAPADEWPSRPVRMVNTFAAGGTADVLTRLVAEHLSTAFKQQFFVETRAGAGGTIGVQSVANTPPDGYNFVLTNMTQLVLLPISNAKLGYDPRRDLTHIAYVAGSPLLLSVNAKSGIKTLTEFIEYAKKSDKPLTYSSSGLGSSGHLVAEAFGQQAKIKIEHVPYKGASQGLMDLVAGHIFFSSQTVSSTAAYVRSGTLVALAHTARERLPDFPDVPTFKELGFDVVATIWFSLAGPAGLPNDIVQKVNGETVRALAKPDMQQRLRRDGLVTELMSPHDLVRFIDAETVRWKPVVERVGLVGR
jgi:tripartite-type tricarboxylate transporter receptor subunit TctC